MVTELRIGTILQGGKYKIEKVLGQGSFGITYLANAKLTMVGKLGQMDTTVNVAIKEFFMKEMNHRANDGISIEGSGGSLFIDYRQKFKKEAENLSKMDHPNIVNVLDVFDENDTTYYVMQYIDGQSLDDYILQQDGIIESEAISILKEIGSAVQYMHSHKMLHLDLKPKNVMLDKDGKAYLIDFGLSKQYTENGEPESSTSIGAGTPGYAPIEQANYKPDGSFPTTLDVYALGATFFKMLSGNRPPYASEILEEGLDIAALTKKGVSRSTIDAVQKAMAPIKKDRYQTVAELSKALSFSSSSDIVQEDVNETKVTIHPDTDKIDFYFGGSSVPPPYHRSYETHITEHSISLRITCYSDVLYEGKFPFNKSRYDNLLNVICNLNIKSTPEKIFGVPGSETLTLALNEGDEKYFSCHIYGDEYNISAGTTDANLYILKREIEKCIPDFQALLSGKKDEETVLVESKDKEALNNNRKWNSLEKSWFFFTIVWLGVNFVILFFWTLNARSIEHGGQTFVSGSASHFVGLMGMSFLIAKRDKLGLLLLLMSLFTSVPFQLYWLKTFNNPEYYNTCEGHVDYDIFFILTITYAVIMLRNSGINQMKSVKFLLYFVGIVVLLIFLSYHDYTNMVEKYIYLIAGLVFSLLTLCLLWRKQIRFRFPENGHCLIL